MWQQIETAPRDGTWVLLQAKGALIPMVASWRLDEFECSSWVDSEYNYCPYANRATHWMPLPEPPK